MAAVSRSPLGRPRRRPGRFETIRRVRRRRSSSCRCCAAGSCTRPTAGRCVHQFVPDRLPRRGPARGRAYEQPVVALALGRASGRRRRATGSRRPARRSRAVERLLDGRAARSSRSRRARRRRRWPGATAAIETLSGASQRRDAVVLAEGVPEAVQPPADGLDVGRTPPRRRSSGWAIEHRPGLRGVAEPGQVEGHGRASWVAPAAPTARRPRPAPRSRGCAPATCRAAGCLTDRHGPARAAAGEADAGQGRDQAAHRRRPLLRAQVGRLPLHRLPRRRRGGAGQPQRAPADPLLPRGGRGGQGQPARAVRRRRRDRRPAAATGCTSRRCSSASTPPSRGSTCWPSRRRRPSSPSTCWPSATSRCWRRRSPSGGRGCESALAGARPPVYVTAHHPGRRHRAALVRRRSRAPGSTASSPRPPTCRTAPTSG